MHATVSSIHVNGWYGSHNKLEGARWIVRELWGRRLDDEMPRWAYVGDSTNDALMFQHFDNSIGVANVRRFEAALSHLPRYVAQPGARRRLRRSGGGGAQGTLKATGLARATTLPAAVLLISSSRAL